MNKNRINQYIEDHTFIKHFFREKIEHTGTSFLNVIEDGEEYIFSIERLTIRRFKGDDFKKNNNRKIFNNASFRIALYLEGETDIFIDDKLKKVTPLTLFLQSPGPQISVTPKVYSDSTVLEFYFDLTNMNYKQTSLNFTQYLNKLFGLNIIDLKELNPINETIHVEFQDLFLNLYDKLLEYNGIDNETGVDLIIFDILNKISRLFSEKDPKKGDPKLNVVIRELQSNYKRDYSIEDMANMASLSKHYFQNLFRKEYGITPMEYLTRIRIKHAKFMLKNYNYSCSEISSSIGFNSPLYFSSVFKKYTGMSPTKYRESKQGLSQF